MSLYQMQKCLFDYLRAKKHAPPEQKPDVTVDGYDLTDDERKAVETLDVGKLYALGTHPGGGRRGRKPTVLSYEPIYEWINGMAVVSYAG
jgi:hypothetical protein